MPGVAAGAQADEQALVRVAHFAPGLLKGDVYVVYVNGRLQLKGVPYKTVSDYLKVKPGKFKVEVREAGEPANSPPVVAATVDLEAGKAYTVAVYGQLTSVKAALLTDDMSRPASSKSKVRLIQAIPGEGAVDLVDRRRRAHRERASSRRPANTRRSRRARSTPMSARPTAMRCWPGPTTYSCPAAPSRRWSRWAVSARSSSCSTSRRRLRGVGRRRGRHRRRRDRPSPSPGGRRFALLLLIGGGLAAATGFVVQQRRSSGLGGRECHDHG